MWQEWTLPFKALVRDVALSPDGWSVAIVRQEEDSKQNRQLLEIYRRGLRDPIASVSLSVESSYSSHNLRYCDQGRFIVIHGVNDQLYVFDAKTLSLRHVIIHDGVKGDRNGLITSSVCAANSDVIALRSVSGPNATTAFYSVESGKQIGQEIVDKPDLGRSLFFLASSPSGSRIAVISDNLKILQPRAAPHIREFHAGTNRISSAAFVGESDIAFATPLVTDCCINILNLEDGAIRQLADTRTGSRGEVGASADGRTVMAFSASEWLYRNALQIKEPHFTLWTFPTGAEIARSPELFVQTTAGAMLDFSFTNSDRPRLELSQDGRSVLVSWPGWNRSSIVYRLQ